MLSGEHYDGEGESRMARRLRGMLEDEHNNRWAFEWRPDCVELEVMNAKGTRSVTISATDPSVLEFLGLVVQGMVQVNTPRGSGCRVVRTRG